jgi:uncharacterized protein (DUF1499 family)
MVRRRLVEEPTSRLAIWARRFAVFSLPVALLAIIIGRTGLLEYQPVVVTLGAALVLALIGILLAFGAFVVIWRDGVDGLGYALAAVAIGLLLLAYPTYLTIKGYKLPPIVDITTDPLDPPRFEAIARLRSREANPVAYAGLYAAELQHAAYPGVEPLFTDANAQTAFEATMSVLTKRRWRVIDQRPPTAARREGHIEAVARSAIMGFPDDVVIRIRADGDGTRVDMRSASRYGRYDFGSNAARIKSLLDDVDDVASADKEKQEKQEKPVKPPTKSPGQRGNQPSARR